MARKDAARKDVEYYLGLSYAVELRQYDDGTWFARMPELPGCMTEADTLEAAIDMIRDAQQEWIRACLQDGTPIPEPKSAQPYSGQFRLRLPRSLHQELAERAEREGSSLNQTVVSLLSRALGTPSTKTRTRQSRACRGRNRKAGQAV